MTAQHTHRIVIVGGGAGGLELATRLGRRLGRRGQAEVTLVDPSLIHVWKPLYHEVAAGTLDSQEDALDFLAQARRGHFRYQSGAMSGLDREAQRITLAPIREDGEEIVPQRQLPYDTLVIAVGSVTNHFGIPGAAEHCLHLDRLDEAESFHRRLVHVLLRAQAHQGPPQPLSIAIVGGGATGVELAAELRQAARRAVHYGLDQLDPERDLKLAVVEGSDRLLSPLAPRLGEKAAAQLERIGVQLYLGERVVEVGKDGLHTKSGRFISADLMVWAAGVKAPEFLSGLGLETNRGDQLVVRQDLRTTQDERIFAMGDCASCPQPDQEQPVPPRAQAAQQQAKFLAKHLPRHLRGEAMPGFIYRDRGSLVSLTGNDAVGSLMGNLFGSVMIEGLLARIAYNSLYKQHLASLYGPARTAVMTLAQWLTRPVKPRLKLH